MSSKHKVMTGFGADAAATVSAAKTMILGSTQTEELRCAVEKALAARELGQQPPPLKGPASCDMATMVMDARTLGLPVLEQARVKPRFDPGATTIVDSLDSLTPSAAATALLALPVAADCRTERWKLPSGQRPRLGVVAGAVGVLALAFGYASLAKPAPQQSAPAHIVRPAAPHAVFSQATAPTRAAPLGAAVAAQPAAATTAQLKAAAAQPTAAEPASQLAAATTAQPTPAVAQPAAATAAQPTTATFPQPMAAAARPSAPTIVAQPTAAGPASQLMAAGVAQPAAAAVQAGAVSPAAAAHAFAFGDDARALASYRELARQYPQERSYSVMVDILTARQRSDSRD